MGFSESSIEVAHFTAHDALHDIDESLRGREHLVDNSEVKELLLSRLKFLEEVRGAEEAA